MPEEESGPPDSAPSKTIQYFSAFLSLAADLRDKHLENADPPFAEFLRNVRDRDVGLQTRGTRFVGRGGTFTVRRTVDAAHRPVVLKSTVMGERTTDDAAKSARLDAVLLELKVLTHPPVQRHANIVELLQIGWEGDAVDPFLKWPVLVVEYADLGTLVDYFDSRLKQDVPAAVWRKLCGDVASGLLVIHESGIFHGDLKLENVLVFSDEESGSVVVKLSDFGGAILDGEGPETDSKATPPWTAPECKVKRPRKRHQASDVYMLALLIWRIALSGRDPFQDADIFLLSPVLKERIAQLEAEKQLDQAFLDRAKRSIAKYVSQQDAELLGAIFDRSLRKNEGDRNLYDVVSLLREPNEVTEPEPETTSDTSMEDGPVTIPITQDDFIPFSFAGSEFTPLTMTILPKILESMTHTLNDRHGHRRSEAAIALAMMNLAGDDFGLVTDINLGLNMLTLAAMLGSEDHRVLVYRMHKAFDRPVPMMITAHISEWLEEGASRGSLISAEDLLEIGSASELEAAREILRSRNCGVGVDIFPFDEEADDALLSKEEEEIHVYLEAQMEESKALGQDFSGYLLRLASAYGNTYAVETLIREFEAEVDDTSEIGNTPIIQAAWSGHAEVLELLLHHGADASISNFTGETPLHWLCNFDDKDIQRVGRALAEVNVDLDAVAEEFSLGYDFFETEFVAGTPLHRAVARNNASAVQVLLDIGANPFALGGDNGDATPFMLAVLLHYPHIIRIFLSNFKDSSRDSSEYLITPSGKSILTEALHGGTLFGSTFGRLVRHGHKIATRAEETLQILSEAGASEHFSCLPGFPNCTAVFYASQSHVSVLRFLLNNCSKADIDKPAARAPDETNPTADTRRPPLFEAITHGKIENFHALIEHGADPKARYNPTQPTTIFHQCAFAGFQQVELLTKFIEAGVGVDDGPIDHETPFVCAVLNRSFVIAEFLRDNGANVNALSFTTTTGQSRHPTTVLRVLADENSPGSLACIEFLLRTRPTWSRVSFVVEPATNTSILHVLASLSGDEQDASNTLATLDLCWTYFDPSPSEINMTTRPVASPDESNAIDSGGNTLLHLAVMSANIEVLRYVLHGTRDIDTAIQNGHGFTALELAVRIFSSWEARWRPNEIPKHAQKQRDEARRRRRDIVELLNEFTAVDVRESLLEGFSLASLNDE